MDSTCETVTIPSGTLIHVAGIPFRLIADVEVEGTAQNLALVLSEIMDSSKVVACESGTV